MDIKYIFTVNIIGNLYLYVASVHLTCILLEIILNNMKKNKMNIHNCLLVMLKLIYCYDNIFYID